MRRILTIDGGGLKGVFPAAFLAQVEDSIGERCATYFDLIAGTSTGGVIALALGLGIPARNIVELYETKAQTIFSSSPLNPIRSMFAPRFRAERLQAVLDEEFSTARLGDSSKRLLIPSWSIETGELYVYKTAHSERFEHDFKELAADVAMATCAAPVMFRAHTNRGGVGLVDGALWANNPTGFAVVEAIGVLDWSPGEIHVLSLGCTSETLDTGLGGRSAGLAFWSRKAVGAALTAQSAASLGIAVTLLRSHERVHRISPQVARGRFKLDRAADVPALKGLGFEEARKALPGLRREILGEPAADFAPFHKLSEVTS